MDFSETTVNELKNSDKNAAVEASLG